MHLLPCYWTTTNTRKRKKSKKTKSLLAAEKEHQKFLKRMGVGKSKNAGVAQLAKQGICNAQVVGSIPSASTIFYDTNMSKKEEKIYTGNEIMGIAQMHKSNAIPIRNKKSAEEVAKMRRG